MRLRVFGISSLLSEELKSIFKIEDNRFLLWRIDCDFVVIRMEIPIVGKHVLNSGEHHPCDGNDGVLLVVVFGKALILHGKARLFLTFDSSKGTLDQQRIQILSGLGTLGRFLFVVTLVIGRGKSSSGTKMPVRFKDGECNG